ncbi:rCG30276 [Rattus norvegicus]|uniref:RCG30276 n=1 Tax=Rattus norvegicus TaxID=10116 RepID=A6IL77_RAT|nr:rCG30276 [Rattus norvegicus]
MRRGPGPCTAAPITISLGAHCKVLLPVPTLSLQTSPNPQGQWSEIFQNTYRGIIYGQWGLERSDGFPYTNCPGSGMVTFLHEGLPIPIYPKPRSQDLEEIQELSWNTGKSKQQLKVQLPKLPDKNLHSGLS